MDEANPVISTVEPFPESLNQWVDHIAATHIINQWKRQDELSYLWEVWKNVSHSKYKKQLIALYQSIADDHPVQLSGDPAQSELLLNGLAIAKGEQLHSANEIHRHIFAGLTDA